MFKCCIKTSENEKTEDNKENFNEKDGNKHMSNQSTEEKKISVDYYPEFIEKTPELDAYAFIQNYSNEAPVFFFEENSVFSNFYRCNQILYDKDFNPILTFFCNEQYFMYMKAIDFDDKNIAKKILAARTANICKRLGRQVKNFDEKIWKTRSLIHMYNGLIMKFCDPENKSLLSELLKTEKKYLAEASPYDRIWGIGMNENLAKNRKIGNWPGDNYLGQLLMLLREDLLKKVSKV